MKWFRAAADHGHSEAHFILGCMYRASQGVVQNDVLAYMWFDLAGG